jgi:hypothetical protein
VSHPLPTGYHATVVIEPPSAEPGAWAGAPSAITVDGTTYLAYRLRRPEGHGRGYLNVVAGSTDGVHFETLAELSREDFGAESLERPALVHTPQGRWRLYVSAATPGSKHWRVDLLEADDPADFSAGTARTVLPGSECVGVKDPVVLHHSGAWHLWASCHPLNDPDHTDRMTTHYATSDDGRDWTWHGTVLTGRRGAWDQRGVRVASVLADGGVLRAAYDGRRSAAENWEERTGTATAWLSGGRFTTLSADEREPAASPHPPHGLRYLSAVHVDDGRLRLYYEMTRADGAHSLCCEQARSPEPGRGNA